MRALVVTELFSPVRGGTAVWFDQVYRQPEAEGCQIVTACEPDSECFDSTYPRPIHRVSWQRQRWLRPESLAIYLRLMRRVYRLASQGGVEALHAGRVLPEGLVSVGVGRALRLPVMIYAHGEEITGWREPLKRAAMRRAYRSADVVIANSAFTRDQLLALGVEGRRIAVLHPGVDTERYHPQVDGRQVRARLGIGLSPLILSVGRLQPRKGFDRVIEAMPEIRTRIPGVQYAVVGCGDDEARLRQLSFQNNVADRVHFAGLVPDEELPQWYAACDVFAMPNREINGDTEGFGMVYVEASATGKAVLAGTAGGTGSAVLDGVTGLRVDGRNIREIACALTELLSDPAWAQEMGRLGRERVDQSLTWSVVAGRTLRIHEAMLTATETVRPSAVPECVL